MQWRSFLREATWLLFWTLILLIIAIDGDRAAFSQESKPTREPDGSMLNSLHVHNYGYLDTGCLRWSDGCRTCVRIGTSAFECSNVGIACQPGQTKCILRADSDSSN